MATVLKGQSVSIRGKVYDIYLDNGAPSTGGLEIDVVARSTKITYRRENGDVDAHILASKAQTTFLVKTSAQKAALAALTAADELQYRLRIVRDGNLYWVGFVLLDLVKAEFGGFPYKFSITATDGLARLKSIDYEQGNLDDYITITDHLFHILDKIPLTDYYAAGDEYLRTHSTLWPTDLTPAVDTNNLDVLRVGFKALRTIDQRGEITYQSYYQALLEILKVFNLRLVYSQGRYVLTETADYTRQAAGVTFHRYEIDGSAMARETLTNWETGWMQEVGRLETEDAAAHAGGVTSYLAPLRQVEITYKHFMRQNLVPGYGGTLTTSTVTREVLNFRTNGGNGTLSISGGISAALTDQSSALPPNTSLYIRLAVRVAIVDADDNANGVSLSRPVVITSGGFSYQAAAWTESNVGALAYFVIPMAPTSVTSSTTSNFTIQTPVVPRAGTLLFSVSHQGVFAAGVQYDPATIRVTLRDIFVESILNGSIEDQYNFSIYRQDGTAAVSRSVKLPREHLFGDGPDDNSFGRIEYPDGLVEWAPTSTWRRWAAGTYLTTTPETITKLVARMTMALQDGERKAQDLTLIAPEYQVEYLLKCSSDLYLVDEASLSIDRDEWRGRWFQVAFNFTTSAIEVVNTNDFEPGESGGQVPPDPPSPPIDFSDVMIPPGDAVAGLNNIPSGTDIEIPGGVAADTIEISTSPATVPLFAGDVVLLTNPITGETESVTVQYNNELGAPAADQNNPPAGAVPYYGPDGLVWMVPSDSLVAVETFTPAADIPAGSYVQPDPQFAAQLNVLLRTDHVDANIIGYDTSITPGFTGWYWRPGRRIGWYIRKVHFAFAQDLTGSAKVNLKYYDATGFRYTVATHNAGGLGSVQDAFATVQEGYYRVEVETVTGTAPKGLVVIIELIKTIN